MAVDLASVAAGSKPEAGAPRVRPWAGRGAEENKEAVISLKRGPAERR